MTIDRCTAGRYSGSDCGRGRDSALRTTITGCGATQSTVSSLACRVSAFHAACAAIVSLSLAGCATLAEKPPELLSSVQTVTVKIPVPIPCVAANEKPPIPPTNMRPGTNAEQMHAQMRADIDDWRTYSIKADAIMTSCQNAATPPKGP